MKVRKLCLHSFYKILFALFTFILVRNESQNDKILFALFTFLLVWNESQNDKILFALFTFILVWRESQNDRMIKYYLLCLNILCFLYIHSRGMKVRNESQNDKILFALFTFTE